MSFRHRAIYPNYYANDTYIGVFCCGFTPVDYEYTHDDVIKWNHFPRYWPFVRGIHRSPEHIVRDAFYIAKYEDLNDGISHKFKVNPQT